MKSSSRREVIPSVALLVLAVLLIVMSAGAEYDCGPETIIGGVDEHDDYWVQIDVDSHGRAWAVWSGYDQENGDTEIMYCINDGGVWSEAGVLHGENASADRFPMISIGADDVPWVIWYRAQANGERLWYSRWIEGAWTTPEILRDDADRYDDYDVIAVNSDDVWVATDTHQPERSYRDILIYHWDGSAWSTPWRLSMAEHGCYFPDFALDPQLRPWLVWTGVATGSYDWPVMYSRWTGDAWAAPDTVNGDLNNNVGSQIVFDGSTPMVLWNGNMAANVDIEYSRLESGAWTAPALVNLPDSSSDEHDNLGACESGGNGNIAVVWSAGEESHVFSWDILWARWTGNEWTSEQPISGDAPRKIDTYGDVAVSDDGSLWSAWVCYEEIAYPWDQDIRAASCVVTTPVDFGPLVIDVADEVATVSWCAAGEAAAGPFFVWRSTTPDPAVLPAEPDGGAAELNTEGVTSVPYRWQDEEPPQGALALYWVEWRRPTGSVFIGPVLAAIGVAAPDLPARLVSVSPNPVRTGAAFHVSQFSPGSAEVVLYTVGGREVTRLHAPAHQASLANPVETRLLWDGTAASGARVASGVYVAQLMVDAEVLEGQRRMVTVIR